MKPQAREWEAHRFMCHWRREDEPGWEGAFRTWAGPDGRDFAPMDYAVIRGIVRLELVACGHLSADWEDLAA
ncbi:hypothetical protein [Longimicrobium sp.]|jgi:hypothetical protein|uniref:hypothetical protein n=1 Tax=Longimicrobium sp. TaxID=2029185 RepID=UPI002F94CF8D